jgi:hypothetical protein
VKETAKFGIPMSAEPSAILAGMEALARRIWLVNPYISSLGKLLVARYIARVKPWLFSQTFCFLKSFN